MASQQSTSNMTTATPGADQNNNNNNGKSATVISGSSAEPSQTKNNEPHAIHRGRNGDEEEVDEELEDHPSRPASHHSAGAAATEFEAPEEHETFDLGEDIYSLIFVSPICSAPFIFSSYIVMLKLALFTFLAIDLQSESEGDFDEKTPLIRLTQFLMLPVAIAIQEDLMYVYTRVANVRYDRSVLKISPAASEWKFTLSFLLRFIDGLYSLTINFVLLMVSNEVLSLFLNFAALAFLQSIDDVAFRLAAEGYLGDRMEDHCIIVKQMTLPRRVGDRFTNSLDTILFGTTLAVMMVIFAYVTALDNANSENQKN